VEPAVTSPLTAFVLALLVGAGCTDLFYRFWRGLLGCVAVGFGFSRCAGPQRAMRLGQHLVTALGSGLIMFLVFRLYLGIWNMGHSEQEQVAFFVGCLGRMGPLLFVIKREIEALFDPD